MAPLVHDFGSIEQGAQAAAQSSTLTSTGTVPVNLTLPQYSDASFSVATTCPLALAPGASCEITFGFKPSATGTLASAYVVASNAGASTIQLTGIGLRPHLAACSTTSRAAPFAPTAITHDTAGDLVLGAGPGPMIVTPDGRATTFDTANDAYYGIWFGSGADSVAVGPDGTKYWVHAFTGSWGSIDTTGGISPSHFEGINANPTYITADSDGVWVVDWFAKSDTLYTPSGAAVKSWAAPIAGLSNTSDGRLLLADGSVFQVGNGQLYSLTTSGPQPITTSVGTIVRIAAGGDGTLWAVTSTGIAHLSESGTALAVYPTPGGFTAGIPVVAGNGVWVTGASAGNPVVDHMTFDGTWSDRCKLPAPAQIADLTTDGNIWIGTGSQTLTVMGTGLGYPPPAWTPFAASPAPSSVTFSGSSTAAQLTVHGTGLNYSNLHFPCSGACNPPAATLRTSSAPIGALSANTGTAAGSTAIQVSALPAAVTDGAQLTLISGTHSQAVTVQGNYAKGYAGPITVLAFTPAFDFPAGTAIPLGAWTGHTPYWTNVSDAAVIIRVLEPITPGDYYVLTIGEWTYSGRLETT